MKTKLETVIESNALSQLERFFLFRLPKISTLFFIEVFKVFQKLTGFSLGVIIPEKFSKYTEPDPLAIFTAEKLRKQKIIEWYSDKVREFPDEPSMPYRWLGKNTLDQPMGSGFDGYGYDFFDTSRALWSMAGESVERWAISTFADRISPSDYVDTSLTALSGRGENLLNINDLAGYTKELRDSCNSVNLKFDEKTNFRWISGVSLTSQKKIWVPLQLVSFYYDFANGFKKEPLILEKITTGTAAYSSRDGATTRALLELIERDAFMIYWLGKITPLQVDLKSIKDFRIEHLVSIFSRYNLEIYALYLKTDAPVHSILGLIIDRSGKGPAVAVGAASNADLIEAIYRALAEAHASRVATRKKDEENLKQKNTHPVDYSDINQINHLERLSYWALPGMEKKIDWLITGEKKSVDFFSPQGTNKTSKDVLSTLILFLKENSYEAVAVPLCDPTLEKEIGISVMSVVAPNLQPLHLREFLPCFGGDRLWQVPQKLGIKRSSDEVNKDPHPFP